MLREPSNVLSAVWVHTIPGQAKTTLATTLELICGKQMQDKFEDPAYKGISVFCSITTAGLSEFHPIPLEADYLVLPMVLAAGEIKLRIAHENACSDSDKLVVRRLPCMEYPMDGVSQTFTLLPPCRSLTPMDRPSARELVHQPSLWYNLLYTCTTQGYRQPAMNHVGTSQDEIVAGRILYMYTSQTIQAPWPRVEPPNLCAGTGAVEAKESSPAVQVEPQRKSSCASKTRAEFFLAWGGDTNDEICHLASEAASSSQRQEADFIPGVESNPGNPSSTTGGGILVRAGANTNLSVITGKGIEMQYFGSTGSSCTKPNVGAQIDKIIREQAWYMDALEKDMEVVAEQIIHSGAEVMRQTGGRTDEFLQDLNTLVTKFFLDAWEIQMSMDGSTSVDVGAKLNRLEQRTEEMVKTATDLAARYEAGSRTFDATLREAEAKIKEEMDV